ncbi:MAG TPA: hypothetical protein VFD70_25060 [Anaerolineae bacterium]|nr:hypothetical protein [Anaerolineae bacterium]
MPDSTLLIQLLAIILFAVCLYHSWNTEGARAAQQWFITGYIFALLLISLLVVTQQIAFNPAMLFFGAAPSLTIMLLPAVIYLAYTIARQFAEPTNLRTMTFLTFLLTPALMLPIDATALNLDWWSYPTESTSFLDGIPFYAPFAWGVIGAAFFLLIGRIRKIRFRGNGQIFAMIIAVPVLAALLIGVIAVVQILVYGISSIGGEAAMYIALALIFIALPVLFVFRTDRRPLTTKD